MFLTISPNMVVSKNPPIDTTKLWWDAEPVEESLSNKLLFQTSNPDISSILGENKKLMEVVTTTSSLKAYDSNSKTWNTLNTVVGYPVAFPGWHVYRTSAEVPTDGPAADIPLYVIGPDGILENDSTEFILINKGEWDESIYNISATNCNLEYQLVSDTNIRLTISNPTGPVTVTVDIDSMGPV